MHPLRASNMIIGIDSSFTISSDNLRLCIEEAIQEQSHFRFVRSRISIEQSIRSQYPHQIVKLLYLPASTMLELYFGKRSAIGILGSI